MYQLPILQNNVSANLDAFVNYWNQFYDESYKDDYLDTVCKPVWEKKDIEDLCKWKNNMGKTEKFLSKTKKQFVEKAALHLEWMNSNKNKVLYTEFTDRFKKSGHVWSITVLHAIDPLHYPVYDQYVHRANCWLEQREFFPLNVKNTYQAYEQQYLPFFREVAKTVPRDIQQLKLVDNALWAFGKFLKLYPGLFK